MFAEKMVNDGTKGIKEGAKTLGKTAMIFFALLPISLAFGLAAGSLYLGKKVKEVGASDNKAGAGKGKK